MSIRFFGARILSAGMEVKHGEVWTVQDKIIYAGVPKEIPENISFDRQIDLKGNLIMPSFKNAHTHSAMTFLRSYADDLPLKEWLFEKVFPLENQLTGEDIYWLTRLAHMEYLTSGITACFDMYFEPDYVAKASADTGFRTVMCGSVSGTDDPSEVDSALLRLEDYFNKFRNYDEKGLVSYRLGFHAEYTTGINILKGISELSKKYKQPVYTHNSETVSEVKGCMERHNGMTPTELFLSAGLFEYGGKVHLPEHVKGVVACRPVGAYGNIHPRAVHIGKSGYSACKLAV